MNRIEKNNNKKIMKRNLAASLVLLFIIALSVAGATQAWFASGANLQNVFTAGTVILSEPVPDLNGSAPESSVQMQALATDGSEEIVPMVAVSTTCKTVKWSFENTGSKKAFVRVRPKAEFKEYQMVYIAIKADVPGTNWAGTSMIIPRGPGGSDWFYRYFTYQVGSKSNETDALVIKLTDGGGNHNGNVLVWDALDQNGIRRLYIKIVALDTNTIGQIYMYAGVAYPPSVSWNEYYFQDHANGATTFTMRDKGDGSPGLTYIVEEQGGSFRLISDLEPLVKSLDDITVCDDFLADWHYGTDGWWYYGSKESPCNGPYIVPPGKTVEVCFSHCYDGSGGAELVVSLEAEAVQWSNGAIDSTSVDWSHPWKGLSWSPCE